MYGLAAAAGLFVSLLTPAFGCAGTPPAARQEAMAPEGPREYVDTAGRPVRVLPSGRYLSELT